MKKLLWVSSLVLSTSLLAAAPGIPLNEQIASFSVEEVSSENFKSFNGIPGGAGGGESTPERPYPKPTLENQLEKTGKVIQVARDLVALGESIYELAKKGKPTNITEYAPISVVPRDPISKEYADVFDLENFSMPIEKSYVAKVKNGLNKEVVTFSYKVIYSYGGSYNGRGKYLTNVIIVPGAIRTSFGWDFNASMKLSGIMNHGTKLDPVAGVMVTVKYQMNSWSSAYERNDTIHLTGRGELKTFTSK
jgi:hypothetical protein